MASILSSAMITNAQGSVNTYINTANQLYSELQSIINNLTADGFQSQIHLFVLVFENAQAEGLFRKATAFSFGIIGTYTKQNQKTFANLTYHLAVDGDGGGVDSC